MKYTRFELVLYTIVYLITTIIGLNHIGDGYYMWFFVVIFSFATLISAFALYKSIFNPSFLMWDDNDDYLNRDIDENFNL